MLRDAEEEVVRQLALVIEHGDARDRVDRAHPAIGNERDAPLGERLEQCGRRVGRRWDRCRRTA